jgi:hypothetical protein
MTVSEQSAVMLEAIEQELLQPEDVVRWADGLIMSMDKPPPWIIDLSTANSPHLVEFASTLRDHVTATLPIRRQIQVIVLSYNAGLISLSAALKKLFRLTIIERKERLLDAQGSQLKGLLVQWDCQHDLNVIEPALEVKVEEAFRDYLTEGKDIKALLPWKFERAI